MANTYYDEDADISNLHEKSIGIIGYGNQGRAQALNMRDSGVSDIIIGTARDETFTQAEEDGFEVDDLPEIASKSDILFLLIPDEIIPRVYREQILPHLEPGNVLNFASGYNITFEHIVPPSGIDTIMIAPRMIGDGVRSNYLNGEGFPAFIAVEQDATGEALQTALALAKAMGATKMGSIEVTFKDETMLDLLAEQAIWPMIISILVEAFHFEVEKGHPPEASLIEMYMSREPAYMFEKMAEDGLFKQFPYHSHTSQYGQLSRIEALDKSFIRETLADAYKYIENGKFAREWEEEQEKGLPNLKRLLDQAYNSMISEMEDKIKKR
ncbi:ketol-acid reductoisomerase [Aliifodinibius sp. S!AR15-10]|uniref:ketol-acid reductoisomerase n=1 Tax=Aliifodinibius sp. S!AR15-10 TaxID=2950437 RepID=UPI002857BF99|nr:ketol-acid reductoisomerase [Aliifodinibius sp. S!AR15-10]MDR8389806.1 ketol-acid reductoisomerase [Aliifodinibius sp. S!AR15-10]